MKKYGIWPQWRQLATQVHGPVLCGVQHYPPKKTHTKQTCTKTIRKNVLFMLTCFNLHTEEQWRWRQILQSNKQTKANCRMDSVCLGRLHSVTSSAVSQHSISMTQKNQCFTWSPLQQCHNTPFQWQKNNNNASLCHFFGHVTTLHFNDTEKPMCHSVISSAVSHIIQCHNAPF